MSYLMRPWDGFSPDLKCLAGTMLPFNNNATPRQPARQILGGSFDVVWTDLSAIGSW